MDQTKDQLNFDLIHGLILFYATRPRRLYIIQVYLQRYDHIGIHILYYILQLYLQYPPNLSITFEKYSSSSTHICVVFCPYMVVFVD